MHSNKSDNNSCFEFLILLQITSVMSSDKDFYTILHSNHQVEAPYLISFLLSFALFQSLSERNEDTVVAVPLQRAAGYYFKNGFTSSMDGKTSLLKRSE